MSLRLCLAVLGSSGVIALGACSSDLPAPDNHNNQPDDGDAGPDTGGGGELELDCGSPPNGAVEAEYMHQLTGMGGITPYFWTAAGLPPGLEMNSATGEITGIPEEEGTFDVTFSATDNSNPQGMGAIDCTIDVNPRFSLEPFDPGDVHLPCVVRGDDVQDLVQQGTGDGSPVSCRNPMTNSGNGSLPDGVTITDDCQIMGNPTGEDAQAYGTWTRIIEVVQSGVVRYAPFCITTQPNPGDYDIKVFRDGDNVTDTALAPFTGTFSETGEFSVRTADPTDPTFEIVSPADCAPNACFFGFFFFATGSPFDIGQTRFNGSQLLRDSAMVPIGFTHGFEATGPDPDDGPNIDPRFLDRPWVMDITVTYCIADNEGGPADDDGPCEGKDNVLANGENVFQLSVIMTPEPA